MMMIAPPEPPRDDKDWTWVLERPCPECGYDAAAVDDIAARTRAAVAVIRAAVRGDELDRPGHRSNGSALTVDTLGRYFLHDLQHHAHDVAGA